MVISRSRSLRRASAAAAAMAAVGLGIFGGKAGSGSVGGKGGKVSIDNSGNVTTQGHDAGGALRAEHRRHRRLRRRLAADSSALGGWAATGGDGGAVSVSNSGTIRASAPTAPGSAPTVQIPICGDGCSPGIFAQSIGGGGGQAGSAEGWFSVGAQRWRWRTRGRGRRHELGRHLDRARQVGRDLRAEHRRRRWLRKQRAWGRGPGLRASRRRGRQGRRRRRHQRAQRRRAADAGQGVPGHPRAERRRRRRSRWLCKIGGAGPWYASAPSAAVGGSGGVAGNGGEVSVTVLPKTRISTAGEHSVGIDAQSVGGGGGSGAYAVTVAAQAGGQIPVAMAFGMGGRGGAGGNGAAVTVTSDAAEIATGGDRSPAVSAQSVGGGGGHGGYAVTVTAGQVGSFGASVGGDGGRGGAAFPVNVVQSGPPGAAITTHGRESPGITAQSVGGGGERRLRGRCQRGCGGTRSVSASAAPAARPVPGPPSRWRMRPRSPRSGPRSTGIFAQSISDGGGRGDYSFAGGLSGKAGVSGSSGRRGGKGRPWRFP